MDTLIRILRQNSTIPRADLARQLAISEPELAARIAKLEADGTILGYHAAINREKWDADAVSVRVGSTALPAALPGSRRWRASTS